MTSKIDNIIQDLKSLTLLEAAELVKEIEDVFGVDASASNSGMMMMSPGASLNNSDNEEQEKTEFNVLLEVVPAPKKIAILKVVRSLTGLGLIEAKGLVESAPRVLKEAVSKEDAEDMKQKLEGAGATVLIN